MATATAPARTADFIRRPRRTLRFASDAELVRLVRCGDESAFEAIYDRHHRGILAFCRHMVGSREEGEDAVQHTFAAAYRDLTESDKPIQLKAWLYTIARNRCLSILRARREQVSIEDAEPATEGLAAEVQRRQDLRDMLGDLQALPEDQRAALVLAELGALSHEEIAVSLDVRKDKVKALVFQARESLAASRKARETDCREIQEQLSVLRGGALRRTEIRRHVDLCPACQEFKAETQRQRAAMAVLLPVVPSIGLRETALGAAFGGGAAMGGGALGGGAAGGLLAASGAKGLAAKVLTLAAVAGTATGGGLVAIDELSDAPADSRNPLAIAPSEQGAVQLVEPLRERAGEVAEQRTADRRVAVRARRSTTTTVSTTADRPARRSGAGSRAKARRRAAGTGDRARIRKSADGVATPLAVPAEPLATTPTAVETTAGTTTTTGAKGTPPGQAKRRGPKLVPPGQLKRRGPKLVPPGQLKRDAAGKPTPPGQLKRRLPRHTSVAAVPVQALPTSKLKIRGPKKAKRGAGPSPDAGTTAAPRASGNASNGNGAKARGAAVADVVEPTLLPE